MVQLVSKSSTGKLRIILLDWFWCEEINGFRITRQSGQFRGKMTDQPSLDILVGKAKRTLVEQKDLEFNHLIKEKLDKGYKLWEKPLEESTEEELLSLVGDVSNQEGVLKPMLAKQADKVVNKKIFNAEWLASPKIDGLRIIIYMGNDGELHTSSRGAMNYDAAMVEILTHPTLIRIFKEYPGLMLDGEGYKWHYSLQSINTVARTQVVATDYSFLEFYWYDIVDITKPFVNRLQLIDEISAKYGFSFNPNRVWSRDELRIQKVPHTLVSGWDNIMELHNQYVDYGWEGLVIRDPNRVYKPNGRTNDMIKIKIYNDDIFKVIGIEQGLREYDDMVFILAMSNGKTFKAKPYGDHDQKVDYTNNFEKNYLNHYVDCKFFCYSDDGIPLQPNVKYFRLDEDVPEDKKF